jgi:hypothetical protein
MIPKQWISESARICRSLGHLLGWEGCDGGHYSRKDCTSFATGFNCRGSGVRACASPLFNAGAWELIQRLRMDKVCIYRFSMSKYMHPIEIPAYSNIEIWQIQSQAADDQLPQPTYTSPSTPSTPSIHIHDNPIIILYFKCHVYG